MKIHSRIVLYVLDATQPAALSDTPVHRARMVGAIFAHIHNNRLAWLEPNEPDLIKGLRKMEADDTGNKIALEKSLRAFARTVEVLLQRGIERGKVSGFKPHPAAFLGYLIGHEAYHHGEIGITLAQAGHSHEKEVAFGMWDWGKS